MSSDDWQPSMQRSPDVAFPHTRTGNGSAPWLRHWARFGVGRYEMAVVLILVVTSVSSLLLDLELPPGLRVDTLDLFGGWSVGAIVIGAGMLFFAYSLIHKALSAYFERQFDPNIIVDPRDTKAEGAPAAMDVRLFPSHAPDEWSKDLPKHATSLF